MGGGIFGGVPGGFWGVLGGFWGPLESPKRVWWRGDPGGFFGGILKGFNLFGGSPQNGSSEEGSFGVEESIWVFGGEVLIIWGGGRVPK